MPAGPGLADLADATLTVLADRLDLCAVFTLDSNFHLCRLSNQVRCM